MDCNLLDDIEEIEQKRTPKKVLPQNTSSAGYSYDDTDGAIIAPPITAAISKQESHEAQHMMGLLEEIRAKILEVFSDLLFFF